MAINFNSFTEGTTSNIQSNDYVVGFDNTSPGGERKWTVSTIANAVSGIITPSFSQTPAFTGTFKNKLINGDMKIWQRGTTFTGITPTLGIPAYTSDRWFVAQLNSQSSTDVTRQIYGTAPRIFTRIQKRAGSTGASFNILGQVIESSNCLDLVNKTLTLSFVAKAGANYSASSNILEIRVATCTSPDESSTKFLNGTAAGYSLIKNITVTLTESNQLFTISGISIPSNATNIAVWFTESSSAAAAGTNDWFEISNVQLEEGSTATPFEHRPIGTELALCQRYYQIIEVENSKWAGGIFVDITSYEYFVAPRATPTSTVIAAGTNLNVSSIIAIPSTVILNLNATVGSVGTYAYANRFYGINAEL